MASVNDICEVVKKCKILLLDIEGTTTSISFVKDKLFIYAEENVKEFLDNQWENEEVKEVVAALRKLAIEDKEKDVKGVVAIPGEESSKDEQIEGLVNNVKWQMLSDRKVGPLKQLQGLIWKLGYDKGEIKGHVYDDVKPALEQWKSTEGQKVYIYSSGSVQAQKLLFGQSMAGDLLPLIEGHFDTAVGAKQEAASYVAIAEKIGCKPEEILFLTDVVQEAEAARASGLQAALVTREGNVPLPADATASYPVLHTFDQLHAAASNKRKTDDQVEEQPAKVPKTDVQDNVKTTTEAKETVSDVVEAPTKETAASEPIAPEPVLETAESEKMETEEVAEKVEPETKTPEEVVEKSPVQVETVVEEVTDTMDTDVPMCDVKPVVEETDEKTKEVETVKLETKAEDSSETAKPKEPADKEKQDVPITEETPAVITEIEEVTENLNEVADIIEDLVPVVEEPPNEDMEELKNVGDVLEKECDEILSKVQDVTNLDSIPIKPMLNTIAEETMETENTDSNDIVDRILDTEMELGLKASEDIDLNTVQEVTDAKTDLSEEIKDKEVVNKEVTEKTIENKPTENVVEEANTITTDSTAASKVEEVQEEKPTTISNGDAADSNSAPAQENVTEKNDTESSKVEPEEITPTPQENVTKPDEKDDEASKNDESKVVEEKEQKEPVPLATEVTEAKESVPEVAKVEKESEKQVNGKATNGDSEINVNGEASKEEELSARLSVDNGKEIVNGSNGDSTPGEKQNENVETEISDIKVKSVPSDEPRTDPIEQPTEA